MLDAANTTFEELERVGGKSEARNIAVKVAKQAIKRYSPSTFVLMVELPSPIRVHTGILQEEALGHLGEGFASGEILHVITKYSSKMLRVDMKSSADGVAYILPVMDRQEDASDEDEVDVVGIIASKQRECWITKRDECTLTSKMKHLELDTATSGEHLGVIVLWISFTSLII